MRNSNTILEGMKVLLIVIGLFSVITWSFPKVHRLVDESTRIQYEFDERYEMLESAYSLGLRFGEDAATNYEGEFNDMYTVALEHYENKEPSVIGFGPEDIMDFPGIDDFESWTWRSYIGEKDTNDVEDAFKSGYIDGFVNYYKD